MAQRLILPKSGDYKVFRMEEFSPDKELKNNHIRVEVHYSGVNFADCLMRKGLYQDSPSYPFVPGYEISGIITEVGSNSRWKVGQRVMAGTYFGGYASEVIIPEDHAIELNSKYSLEQGASLIVSYLTSYMAFIEQGRAREGDQILIDCRTGSLGIMSSQILEKIGARVTGLTSSPNKKNSLQNMGKQILLHEELKDQKFDIILNSRGGISLKKDFKRLKPNGHLISIGISDALGKSFFKKWKTLLSMPWFWIVKLINENKKVSGLNLLRFFDYPDLLQKALQNFDRFDIDAPPLSVFKAREIGEAQEFIENRKSSGKVILSWRD